jgi:hypothetical protein
MCSFSFIHLAGKAWADTITIRPHMWYGSGAVTTAALESPYEPVLRNPGIARETQIVPK